MARNDIRVLRNNDKMPVRRGGLNKWLNVWKGRRGGSCLSDATLCWLAMDPLLLSSVCLARCWKIRRTWYRPTHPVSCLNLWPMIFWECRDLLDVMLLLLILLPPSSFVESNSVVGVVGGSESILLDRQRESLVLASYISHIRYQCTRCWPRQRSLDAPMDTCHFLITPGRTDLLAIFSIQQYLRLGLGLGNC